jgi:chromosome segregation ATPase
MVSSIRLQSNEEEVQQRFRTMVKTLTETCVSKSTVTRDNSTQKLLKFSSNLKDSVSKEHLRLNSEIEKLKEQVEEAKQKKSSLKKELEDTKKSLLEQQEVRFNKVKDIQTQQFSKLNDKVDSYVALVDKEKLAMHVTDKVQTYVNKYREEQRTQMQQGSSSSNVISNNIKEYISREINKKLDQLKPPANTTVAQEHLESLEKTAADLSKFIEKQKEKAEATQKQLASLNPTQSDNNQAKTVTKHMEEVERHITVMYHNIKMVENFINFKVNNIAGGLDASNRSRKRARLENGEMDVDDQEDVFIRLTALEEKHQQMIDYVVQFRDNVLDPAFPTRIESALSKIEQVLL